MLLCVERLERNTREKERVCFKSFCLVCKLIVVEIKQCVLSPLSVSKPLPVVSPTNSLVNLYFFPQEKLRKPLLREECRKKTLLKEVKPAAVAGKPLNQYRQLLY